MSSIKAPILWWPVGEKRLPVIVLVVVFPERNPKMETSTGSPQLNSEQPLVNSSSSERFHSGASRCQVFESESESPPSGPTK